MPVDMPKDTTRRDALPVASYADRLAIMAQVTAPTLAKGPLIRRPRVVAISERLGLDGRAVRRMAALREKYGDGPLLVPIPGRVHALLLSPGHVERVLRETPEPFTSATDEKKAALGHFEPNVSLVSEGGDRTMRRAFNERVLETSSPVHSLAASFLRVVEQEAARLLAGGERLDWPRFMAGWYRVVRRVVLGDGAAEDEALTDLLEEMRGRGNLVVLVRRKTDLIDRFRAGVHAHIERGDEGSLAGLIARMPEAARADPADQIAHYLFAFDPGGMASFRALALLAAHPDALARLRDEAGAATDGGAMLPFARACLLESLRLWPTTPAILRQCTRDVDWDGATMAKDTNILIFAPFFHRDDSLPFAHAFTPSLWLENTDRPTRTAAMDGMALVPFSFGGASCPAADFVPMIAGAMLAALTRAHTPRLTDPGRLSGDKPMPPLLDNYTLAFDLAARTGS